MAKRRYSTVLLKAKVLAAVGGKPVRMMQLAKALDGRSGSLQRAADRFDITRALAQRYAAARSTERYAMKNAGRVHTVKGRKPRVQRATLQQTIEVPMTIRFCPQCGNNLDLLLNGRKEYHVEVQ